MNRAGMLLAGVIVVAGFAFGSMGAGVASAAEPDPQLEAELGPRPWLRRAIVLAAADTIGVHPVVVQQALLDGHSLKELGIRNGVRPTELAAGIIRHVHVILHRWADEGYITREQAVYGTRFVESHIRLIINNHFEPGPGPF